MTENQPDTYVLGQERFVAKMPLQNEVDVWARATFPRHTATQILEHIEGEVGELRDANTFAEACEQIGDVMILLLALAGMWEIDLQGATIRRLDEVKTWQWTLAEGVYKRRDPSPIAVNPETSLDQRAMISALISTTLEKVMAAIESAGEARVTYGDKTYLYRRDGHGRYVIQETGG